MSKYTLYDTATGQIKWHVDDEGADAALARFDDCDGVLEGHIDGNRYVVIAGGPVERGAYANELSAKAWAAFRSERDRRLATCDWTQMPDAPVDRAAWAAYRQVLRDLPATVTDPETVIWPTPPSI